MFRVLRKSFQLTIFAIILTACAPAQSVPMPPATLISIPPTSTSNVEVLPPTPMPTQPPLLILTPDAIQVERWKEYEIALAENFLSMRPPSVLCEWEILGRAENKIYVWAVCGNAGVIASIPSVIHVSADGIIQKVEVPGKYSDWSSDLEKMFPAGIQAKFDYYHFGEAEIMSEHIKWRQEHFGEPPLIVLSATSKP